MESTIIF